MCNFFLTIVILLILNGSLISDDEKLDQKKLIEKLSFINQKENSGFYYEAQTVFYVMGTPVKILGYYDSNQKNNDWFVGLSASPFYLPIFYYLEGSFYLIDLQSGNILCIKNCNYKLIVNKNNIYGIPELQIIPEINKFL